MSLCTHGQRMTYRVHSQHIDAEALNDPLDLGIMEFYSACDCCGYPMHKSQPYQFIEETGETLCFHCRRLEFPMPLATWETAGAAPTETGK